MSRTLILLFRRDPSADRETEKAKFEGYKPLWPDGRPVAVNMDAFCKHGLRLLGLGKHLAGCQEKLVKLICVPLAGREDQLTRIPGHRVRRFFLRRTGDAGQVHFMDGTPTVLVLEEGIDDPRVTHWIGLNTVKDGEILWFDLAAVGVDTTILHARHRLQTADASSVY